MLSLFGLRSRRRPFQRLTRELASRRRINLALPEESLMRRRRRSSRVPHTGGKLFEIDSGVPTTRRIHEWLKAGAPEGPEADSRRARLRSKSIRRQAVLEGERFASSSFIARREATRTAPTRDVTDARHLRVEQRDRPPPCDRRTASSPAGQARRGLHHGALRHLHRRSTGHRHSRRNLEIRASFLPAAATTSTAPIADKLHKLRVVPVRPLQR